MGSIHSRKIHKDMDSRRLAPVVVLMSDQYLKDKNPSRAFFWCQDLGGITVCVQ